jgi:hypothetical protein
MLWYRAFGLGLLGACCVLLAMRPPAALVCEPGRVVVLSPAFAQAPAHHRCRSPSPSHGPTIIDVAPGVTASQIARLLVLAPGERVLSIDDLPVTGDVEAGVALASSHRRIAGAQDGQRRFLDVVVAGDHGTRRVLVLLH